MSGLYSMPSARAPRFAAAMTVRPSPEPRSIRKSLGVTFAMSSIFATMLSGVGTQTTSLPSCPTSGLYSAAAHAPAASKPKAHARKERRMALNVIIIVCSILVGNIVACMIPEIAARNRPGIPATSARVRCTGRRGKPRLQCRRGPANGETPCPRCAYPPDLDMHYVVDDYTDPWRKPETILMLHGNAESSASWYALGADARAPLSRRAAGHARLRRIDARCRRISAGRSTSSSTTTAA